jgi:uncharacterized protein YndB with AHSA1/START domain
VTELTDENTVVRASIDVTVAPERAFDAFTARIDSWWKREYHIQPGELRAVGIEPHVGGRLWEEVTSGDVCSFGRVTEWDPPRTFGFAWLIPPDWSVPTGNGPASRVTVTFTPIDSGTRVEVVHDRLDAHGPGWESLRDSVSGDGGWLGLLERMRDVA